MNSKFRFLLLLPLIAFVSSSRAYAVVDFSTYTPTLDHLSAESAYVLIYEATDESNADFSTFEKDSNGEYQKKFYKYTVSIKPDVVSQAPITNSAGNVNSVDGHFVEAYTSESYAGGRAITNTLGGDVGNITSDFLGNYDEDGGAIFVGYPSTSVTEIGNIIGDFIGNHVSGFGGAIYVSNNIATGGHKIESITGNFIGNYVDGVNSGRGGAIYSGYANHNLGSITGDFIGNYVVSTSSEALGGALFGTYSYFGDIQGSFIGNYVKASSNALGGAIYNNHLGLEAYNIMDLSGDFIGNSAISFSGVGQGGAIYNQYGKIKSIKGNFIKNNVEAYGKAYGGAIFQGYDSTISEIEGDFIGNSATSSSDSAYSGAIQVLGNGTLLDSVKSNFIQNYVSGVEEVAGGAIGMYNSTRITQLNGAFFENYAISSSDNAQGGAIYVDAGKIDSLSGDFKGNYVFAYEQASGGAIYAENTSILNSLESSFIENYAFSSSDWARGGAIYVTSSSRMNNVGYFYRNYASAQTDASGGAIYNDNSGIITISGNMVENYAKSATATSYGGAVYNASGSQFSSLSGDFVRNYVWGQTSVYGGAIYNASGSIITLSGDVTENYAKSIMATSSGGGIYNIGGSQFSSLSGDFVQNYVFGETGAYGGAIYNAFGGIIILSGDIVGNYAKSANDVALGGAIYNAYSGAVTIATTESKKNIFIANNYIITNADTAQEEKKLESIFLGNGGVVNLNSIAQSSINIWDPLRSGNDDGSFGAYGEINKIGEGTLSLWGDNSAYGGELNIEEGTFYAMFDNKQDVLNDPLGQRLSFDLSNATISFNGGTVFKPKVTNGQIANIGNDITVNGVSLLRPYNVSSLTGEEQHIYNVDYSKFEGFENNLLKVESQGGVTSIEVKDLEGYEGLSSFADIYRKRDDLSQKDRDVYENIYYTGAVSSAYKSELATVGGEDTKSYQELHKATIRQFNRQIYSRIQNKDCQSCGMLNGFSDQHLWFNVGKNWVEKKGRWDSLGYEYRPTSLAWGYDHDIIPNALTLGLAFSYAFGEVEGTGASDVYSHSDVDEYLLSGYWKYKPKRLYTTGSVGGGIILNKTKLTTSSLNARGEYDIGVLFSNVEFGYDLGNSRYVIEPFVGVDYSYMFTEAYDEKGVGARHFEKTSYNTVELPIGLRLSQNMVFDTFILSPAIELAYARNVGDRNVSVNSYFVGSPESPWAVSGTPDSRDSIRGKMNLKINNIYTPFALNFGYARDSRSGYSDDQLYLTIRYNF
ncbi:MAG: autotransporter domain-containing protein [Alphaproteobacteria bacterium]|nr:autotransporter domain-containing protein [Alphaproteobacteria bacterium]